MRKPRQQSPNSAEASLGRAQRKRSLDASATFAQQDDLSALVGPLTPAPRRRGRPPSFDIETVWIAREQLIWFLESNWPELQPVFKNGRTPASISAALAPYPDESAALLSRNSEALAGFLKSGRYFRDPRQIANAMAGVGSVSWRRSFDVLGKKENASRQLVHDHAMRDYFNRKFHGRFLKLLTARSLEEIATIVRGTRTRDKNMKRFRNDPEAVWRILREGRSREPKGG